jgi:hypothetical protein
MEWGILVQRAMNPRFIIIRRIPTQDPAQMRLPKYDHVVETFPSDRADQSLDVRVPLKVFPVCRNPHHHKVGAQICSPTSRRRLGDLRRSTLS